MKSLSQGVEGGSGRFAVIAPSLMSVEPKSGIVTEPEVIAVMGDPRVVWILTKYVGTAVPRACAICVCVVGAVVASERGWVTPSRRGG